MLGDRAIKVPDSPGRVTTFVVRMPRPETHLFEIEMSIPIPTFGGTGTSFDLVLPSWAPGSYLVRDFARHVRDLTVEARDGHPCRVEKVEKNRWRVETASKDLEGPFQARYRVYANDLSVRTSHLDASHGYGNGSNLFFYVEGRKDELQAARFELPAGWKVAIALPEEQGLYRASNYDELVDSPFECGTHRNFDFDVRGKRHTLAIWGSGNEDPVRLVRDLGRLVEAGAALFGGLPYERYLFILHLAPDARGGLEHRASQTVGMSPWKFKPESAYRQSLLLFSHEFFHTWNVKRIRPSALGPFDYTREVYTRDLWVMEGLTSYYEGLLLVRAGLLTPKQLFAEWTRNLKAHRETPGTYVQSLELASFDAWIRHYRPDENSTNVAESYYRRGALVGLALDLLLRAGTRGAASLDDVLLSLWKDFGVCGEGYPEGHFEVAVEKIAPGVPVTKFFDDYVRGVGTPDFESLVKAAGLVLARRPEAEDKPDQAAEPGNDESSKEQENGKDGIPKRSDFGWKTKKEDGRLVVAEVYSGRAAYEAGLNAGDELVALNGLKVDEDAVKRIERDQRSGERILVTVFRRGVLREIPLLLGEREAFRYELKEDPNATLDEKAFFESWLKTPFPKSPAAVKKTELPGSPARVTS